jgi:hypothetical protein
MNDLHTAQLALDIAGRLDARALVNEGCDRNDIDLNRIRQLVAKAPFFLDRLRASVDEAVAAGHRPLVLLVHGWNMAVPWCDVGVGIRERGGQLYGRFPTIGRDRYASFVQPLTDRLFDAGLGASIGLRYPAAGGDNATQLFSGRHSDHEHADVAALAALGANESVDAVQLELGIPLRWPGWRREAFIDALVAAVNDEVEAGGGEALPSQDIAQDLGQNLGQDREQDRARRWALLPKPPRPEIEPDAGCSIQSALADGAGVFMGAEPTGPATMAARVCVALADGSMLLFVGEGPWDGRAGRYSVAGFDWQASGNVEAAAPGRVEVRLKGPLVHYRSHEAFVDLEKGLSNSSVAEADICLEYTGTGESHGKLAGWVRVGEVQRELDEWAICNRGGRRASTPGEKVSVYFTSGSEAPSQLIGARGPLADTVQASFTDAVGDSMPRLEVSRAGETIAEGATPVRVPVYRMLPDGRIVCVTFGTVRFDSPSDSTGVGVYERVEIFGQAATAHTD